jgi:hypothetical protein
MTTVAEARNRINVSPIYLIEITLLNSGPTLYFSDRPVTISSQEYEDYIDSIDGIAEDISFLTSESLNSDITINFKNEPYLTHSYLIQIGDTYPFDGATCTIKEVYKLHDGTYSDVETIFVGILDEPENINLVGFSCNVSDKVISADEKYKQPAFNQTDYPKLPSQYIGKIINDIGFGTVDKLEATGIDVGAVSRLSAIVTSTQTNLTVEDGSLFPTSNFTVQIDFELIQVLYRDGNIFSGLTRGYNNSRAESHGLKTVYEVKTEYIYHLFDHPVSSISKVFIDGKEQSSDYTAYTGQSGDQHSSYPGKAVISFTAEAWVGKQRNYSVEEGEAIDTIFEMEVYPSVKSKAVDVPNMNNLNPSTTYQYGGLFPPQVSFCLFPETSFGEIVSQEFQVTIGFVNPISSNAALNDNDYIRGNLFVFVNVLDGNTHQLKAQQTQNVFESPGNIASALSLLVNGGNWNDYITLSFSGPHYSTNNVHTNFYIKYAKKKIRYKKPVKTQTQTLSEFNSPFFTTNIIGSLDYSRLRGQYYSFPNSFLAFNEKNLKKITSEIDFIFSESPTTSFLYWGYPDYTAQEHFVLGCYDPGTLYYWDYGDGVNRVNDAISGTTLQQHYKSPNENGTIYKQIHKISCQGASEPMVVHVAAINKTTKEVIAYKETEINGTSVDAEEIRLEYYGGAWDDYTSISVSLAKYRKYYISTYGTNNVSFTGIIKEVEYIPDTTNEADDNDFFSSAERTIGKIVSATVSLTEDDGSYTGTNGNLITRPDHILNYILKEKLSFSDSEIDSSSFSTAGTNYTSSSIRLDFAIDFPINDSSRFSDVLNSLAFQCRSVLFFKQGKWYLHYIPSTAPVSLKTIDSTELAGQGMQFLFHKSPRSDIKNTIQIYYKKFYYKSDNSGDYESYYETTDPTSISVYGTRPEILNLWAVRDTTTAQSLAALHLFQKKDPKTLVVFPVFFEHFDLHKWDTFTITNNINNNMQFVIEQINRRDKGVLEIQARSWT